LSPGRHSARSSRRMKTYRAILFDLDGTVVDSHRYTFDAFRHAVGPFGPRPTDAQIFAAFGPSERAILTQLLPASAVDAAYARLQEFYAAHAGGLVVHPAMRRLLEECRAAQRPCGLFTGRGADSTQLLLDRLDLAWAFAAVVAGEQAVRPKPAPDGVLQLLAALGCTAGETLLVGDSPLDCAAAAAAGTGACFATWYAWEGTEVPVGVPRCSDPAALRILLGLKPGAGSA
jgi:HAD superfamily hydrolase (TIGR01509 family)